MISIVANGGLLQNKNFTRSEEIVWVYKKLVLKQKFSSSIKTKLHEISYEDKWIQPKII